MDLNKYLKTTWLTLATAMCINSFSATAQVAYTPSDEIRQAQKEFSDNRFGIFLHWGIYSMFAQGEWYLNRGIDLSLIHI